MTTAPPTRVVFVLSSWHSGSTWVGYVLGSTPDSAFLGEFHRAWDDQARVPCTLCAARGLATCSVLHDLDTVPVAEAFAAAAARTGKSILVDNSKLNDWAAQFMGRGDIDARLVLVVKDPRGWFESTKRRGADKLAVALARWCAENRAFSDFTRAAGGIVVSYDELARQPRDLFPRVFAFCGLPFSDAALRYWNTEHHGFAANGASDAIIKAANLHTGPSHFATGDDAFYQQHSKQLFHDDRWRTALTESEQETIRTDPEVTALLGSLGYRLTATGIVATTPGSWWSAMKAAWLRLTRRR